MIRTCDLQYDLESLAEGDATITGSIGIALSGGQTREIALARALYAQKSVLVLDDALSSLDQRSTNRTFSEVISPGSLARKYDMSVILTTHAIQFLPAADHIIVLVPEGRVTHLGDYKSLHSQNIRTGTLLERQHWITDSHRDTNTSCESLQRGKLSGKEPDDLNVQPAGGLSTYWFYVYAIGI